MQHRNVKVTFTAQAEVPLEDVIAYVKDECTPEQVFGGETLAEWAADNGYVLTQ